MSTKNFRTPKLAKVAQAEISVDQKTVSVLYIVENDPTRRYWIEYDMGVIPATLVVLLSQLGKLAQSLPENLRPIAQTIATKQVRLAMSPDGQIALQFLVEGGAELTLGIPATDLPTLLETLVEAAEIVDRSRHH